MKYTKGHSSLILYDYESSFDSLLLPLNEKSNSSTLHKRFTNQVYKYLNGCSLDLMNEVFYLDQNHHNLQF